MAWFQKHLDEERAIENGAAPQDEQQSGDVPLTGIRVDRMLEAYVNNRGRMQGRLDDLQAELDRVTKEMQDEIARLEYEIGQTSANIVAVEAAINHLNSADKLVNINADELLPEEAE